jgi:hypothetical protein
MALTITVAQLNLLAGTSITEEHFDAMLSVITRLIRAEGYKTALEDSEDYAEAILNNIVLSASIRLATNPTSLRSIGLGAASLGFAGSDTDITKPFSLSADELLQLRKLVRTTKAYILPLKPFSPYLDCE